MTTEAHDQALTLHILTHVPDHEPRETDPHYHLFEAAKARMKRQGIYRCAIADDYCGGNLELHHSHIEFSQQGGADLAKVNAQLGLHLADDEAFAQWIESPGNLEVLCAVHHRTHYGVHVPTRAPLGAAALPQGRDAAGGRVRARERPQAVTPCCDLHGVHCEPPSDLCCHQCTEADHPTHPDGVPCTWTHPPSHADPPTVR